MGVCKEKMGVQQQNNFMSPYNTGENLLSSFSFETGFIYVPSQGRFHCFKLCCLMPGATREYYFTSCCVVEGQTLKGHNYELWREKRVTENISTESSTARERCHS